MKASLKTILIFAAVALLVAILVRLFLPKQRSPTPRTPQPESNIGTISSTAQTTPRSEFRLRFESIPSAYSGISFTYFGSPSSEHYMTEQNGGGIAVFDFDGDEVSDLFFVNGSHFLHAAESRNASNRLYRGDGEFRFRDVTRVAGLEAFNFGHGCAAGDCDNDGFGDLFVATYGLNQLWQNNGDGTFSDVTVESGVGGSGFSSSAAWADLNADGNLDLYVANYLEWAPDDTPRDRVQSPMDFDGQSDLLYQNQGNGRFIEVGQEAGVAIPGDGKGLAVAIADLNGDHRLDIYVANDTRRNFLFRNDGNLKFSEVGVRTGSAVSQDGSIGSSMGVTISDYNRDLKLDLMITNFAQEVVDVLMNMGEAGFLATNTELGLDPVSRPVLNFGILSTDFDLDLWPDLFFANGHIWDETGNGGMFEMPASLLQNDAGRRFLDAAPSAGDYFRQRWLSRAAAMGDLDNDGDTDLVVSHLLAPPAVLRNDSKMQGGSQRVRFIGKTSSRQPFGCTVNVQLTDGAMLTMSVPSGGSFQASHDPVIIVPTGTANNIEWISICWPNGIVEQWHNPPADHTLQLIEGTGKRGDYSEFR
jgi:hypothetical protein